MNVTTHIDAEGSVTVTVDSDDDPAERPLGALALEDLARQSCTSAIAVWVQLRADDDAEHEAS